MTETTWESPYTFNEKNPLPSDGVINFYPSRREVVGSFEVLRGYFWHVDVKPNWFHRLMFRLIFGWAWKDNGAIKE